MKNSRKPIQRVLCVVTVLGIGLGLTGCRTSDPEVVEQWLSPPDTRVILAPGDLVDVKFFYTPELTESQNIRPDGKITLQLVGDVTAAGLTPAQLQEALQNKYTGLIEKPSIVVIARELVHRNVYVAGSVEKPGLLAMPGHLSALEAIMQSGGFDMRSADPKQVVIIRCEDGKRSIYSLDFKQALNGNSVSDPFYLHAQDIVLVPRTGIVKVGQWIDQYVTQLIPKTGFSMFYNTGTDSSTFGVDTTSKY